MVLFLRAFRRTFIKMLCSQARGISSSLLKFIVSTKARILSIFSPLACTRSKSSLETVKYLCEGPASFKFVRLLPIPSRRFSFSPGNQASLSLCMAYYSAAAILTTKSSSSSLTISLAIVGLPFFLPALY